MLSFVGIEDLRTRVQELVKLYGRAFENEQSAPRARERAPRPRRRRAAKPSLTVVASGKVDEGARIANEAARIARIALQPPKGPAV
jgi:hypothetical protein